MHVLVLVQVIVPDPAHDLNPVPFHLPDLITNPFFKYFFGVPHLATFIFFLIEYVITSPHLTSPHLTSPHLA